MESAERTDVRCHQARVSASAGPTGAACRSATKGSTAESIGARGWTMDRDTEARRDLLAMLRDAWPGRCGRRSDGPTTPDTPPRMHLPEVPLRPWMASRSIGTAVLMTAPLRPHANATHPPRRA